MTRENVVQLLESYQSREKKLRILDFEFQNAPRVSANEMIGAMALGIPEGFGGLTGHISDTTMKIALNHEQISRRLNSEAKESIREEYVRLKELQGTLEFYVTLLDREEQEVIEEFYFKGKSLQEISTLMQRTTRTLRTYRETAINKIVEMYGFAASTAGSSL